MLKRKKGRKVPVVKYMFYFFNLTICPLWWAVRNNFYRLRRWANKNKVKILSGFLLFLCLFISFYILRAGNAIVESGKIDVLTAWISAVITIIGIAWTLDHERKENVENHRLTIRPYLIYGFEEDDEVVDIPLDLGASLPDEDEYIDSKNISDLDEKNFDRIQRCECLCAYNEIDLHVADYAEGIIRSIIYRGNEYFLQRPIFLRKNKSYRLILDRYFFLQRLRNALPTIDICVEDMRENTYYYEIRISEGQDSSVQLGSRTFRLVKYDVTGCDCRLESFDKRILKQNRKQERKKFWRDYIKNLKGLNNIRTLIEVEEMYKMEPREKATSKKALDE